MNKLAIACICIGLFPILPAYGGEGSTIGRSDVSDTPGEPVPLIEVPSEPISPDPPIVPGPLQTSYELQSSTVHTDWRALRRTNARSGFGTAVAYGDFDGDGDEDVFVSPGDGTANSTPVEIYLNDGAGRFRLDNEIFQGSVPELVHPRKAIVGDFNDDGRHDIFVAGHGYDKPPFAGEAPLLLLSSASGLSKASGLDHLIGFHHGAASADIDKDGDVDIFVTDTTNDPFFLINDGNGNFQRDVRAVPAGINNQAIYTAELVDVDNDSYPDLLVSGHEFGPGGVPPAIYWGNNSGRYSNSRRTILPKVDGQGVAIDIDVGDLDGDGNKDIVINRTAENPFYSGFYIQIISGQGNRRFGDTTSQSIDIGAKQTGDWIGWLRLLDINGDGTLDIITDDDHGNVGVKWLNDGTGRIELERRRFRPFLHAWIQKPDGLNDDRVRARMDALIRSSDTVVHIDMVSGSTVGSVSQNQDFGSVQHGIGVTYQEIHGVNGVSLAIGHRDTDTAGYLGYGGWLDNSMFSLAVTDSSSGFDADAYSLGMSTGTSPVSGSARWTGAMVGVESHAIGRGRALHGRAEVKVDFADVDVDVRFSNIRYHLEGNITRLDMTWVDLPLNAGQFGSDTIQGVFYGSNHEEVGGVFNRDSIIGAFGAKRQ